jgi:hypothetical protein
MANQKIPLLATPTNIFAEAYPTIARLCVEIVESELMWPKEHGTWRFTESDFRHSVPCSNPECHRGGLAIGDIVHIMALEKLTEREDAQRCKGDEGSPQGRRRGRSCMHTFRFKVAIEYKPTT